MSKNTKYDGGQLPASTEPEAAGDASASNDTASPSSQAGADGNDVIPMNDTEQNENSAARDVTVQIRERERGLRKEERSMNSTENQPADGQRTCPDVMMTALPPLKEASAPTAFQMEEAAAAAEAPEERTFEWRADEPPGPETHRLCRRLAETGKLYRMRDNQMLWLEPGMSPRRITTAVQFEGLLRTCLTVRVTGGGKSVNAIPAKELTILLATESLQAEIPVVDFVTATPTYGSGWKLTEPGYSNGSAGERFFYLGDKEAALARDIKLIPQFLDVMSFGSQSDRTNTVAAALTVLLRYMWPGGKPFIPVTANKSHAGKDTILDFIAGQVKKEETAWHERDWATQNEAVAALSDPDVGVLVLGNIRASGVIESAFVERTVTSPLSRFQSSKRRGDGFVRSGDFVVCATANNGKFSPDLSNRSLPIHLEAVGDISKRVSPIGDPRHEFLPQNMAGVEAELLGMVERWKSEGMPLDKNVRHPMKQWAETVGGILLVNGFEHFLGNWQFQRSANDATRESLAIIADAAPKDKWMRISDIRKLAARESVVNTLMDAKHRSGDRAVERQLGVLLTAHRDEAVSAVVDEEARSYVIRKGRNSQTGSISTVYRFERVIPEAVKE